MKIRSDFMLRQVAGQYVVIPIGRAVLNFNAAISLNGTAAFLWQLLTEGAERDTLVKRLTDEYDTDVSTASNDVDAFINTLKEHDILE